jgi:NTE family protein
MLPGVDVLMRLRPGQAFKVFQEYMEITSRTYTETRLEVDRPDVIVRPEVWRIGLFDEPPVAEMAAIGARAMEQALPDLRHEFSIARRLARRLRPGPTELPG